MANNWFQGLCLPNSAGGKCRSKDTRSEFVGSCTTWVNARELLTNHIKLSHVPHQTLQVGVKCNQVNKTSLWIKDCFCFLTVAEVANWSLSVQIKIFNLGQIVVFGVSCCILVQLNRCWEENYFTFVPGCRCRWCKWLQLSMCKLDTTNCTLDQMCNKWLVKVFVSIYN